MQKKWDFFLKILQLIEQYGNTVDIIPQNSQFKDRSYSELITNLGKKKNSSEIWELFKQGTDTA
jgi:hypothetical protein